ncbi:hypothetical protein U9M48_006466 [Paspalum notatum var. saurae]|uniref:DUF6598 domain-containing protein n=1 Tax=Paspalum notatum var. saurae TaxID=547442 RepID=A0AAQ3SLT7_PASNO
MEETSERKASGSRENLVAGAMGRHVLREGLQQAEDDEAKLEAVRRMEAKAEDDEAKLEPVRRMEAEKEVHLPLAEGLKEKIDHTQDVTLPTDIREIFGITGWDQELTLPTDIREVFGIIGEKWDAATILKLGFTKEQWDAVTTSKQGRKETVEKWRRTRMDDDDDDDDDEYDPWEYEAFRRDWNALWSRYYGSFEDTTTIPPMSFTYKPPQTDRIVYHVQTLQVFSAKVTETSGGLQWPLCVFGFIAIRDCIDHNRNIIFNRTRDNCQTLTQEDHNLVLVGPTRAVVCGNMGPVTIEVDLKVKGTTESEDKSLNFLAAQDLFGSSYISRLIKCAYTSKLSLSTIEFTLGCIVRSVEATIFMRVTRGSWPDDFCSEFAALTTDARGENTVCADNADSIDHEKIILLDSRGGMLPAVCDGNVNLSRRVVSVGIMGELKICVKAWKADSIVMVKEEVFPPLKAGLSHGELDIGFCVVEVCVAWSLILDDCVLADHRPISVGVSC